MQVLVNLVFDGFDYAGMTMTNVADGNSGDHIHVPLAIRTINIETFCPFDRKLKRVRGGLGQSKSEYLRVEVHKGKYSSEKLQWLQQFYLLNLSFRLGTFFATDDTD